MRIIGRREEQHELERYARSDKSELVCVYGRRRVGKTWLIEQTFSDAFAFRATGVEEGNTRQQLKSFHQRLVEYGDTTRTIPRDWFEAFSRMEKLLQREDVLRSAYGKRIVFLDEFPWFDTERSDFLMAFGEFWNRCGTAGGDYLFIICGSATSWIIEKVLENSGSLYHRVTGQIFLSPFSLRETEQFFRDKEFDWSYAQIAECQMVFGGLPFFLDLLHRDESLSQNIDRLCFRPHALLRDESSRLLEATLKKSPVYERILSFLSLHRYGVKRQECFEALNISKGSFERAVDDLVKCDYIRKFKKLHEIRKPIYLRLVDPFLLFHYYFLSGEAKEEVTSFTAYMHDTARHSNWRGTAFELLCLYHVNAIKRALGIAGVRTTEYAWSSRKKKNGAQVDLVIERDDGITDLCEMKFTDRPYEITATYESSLLNKADVFREETKTKNRLRLVMISAAGLAGAAHTEHIAQVLTLQDLFE